MACFLTPVIPDNTTELADFCKKISVLDKFKIQPQVTLGLKHPEKHLEPFERICDELFPPVSSMSVRRVNVNSPIHANFLLNNE